MGPDLKWRRTYSRQMGPRPDPGVVSPSSQTPGAGSEVAPGVPRQMGAQAVVSQQPDSRGRIQWRGRSPGRWEPGRWDPGPRAAKLMGPDLKWRRTFPRQMGARQSVTPSSQTHGAGSEVAPGVPQADGSQADRSQAAKIPSSQTHGVGV